MPLTKSRFILNFCSVFILYYIIEKFYTVVFILGTTTSLSAKITDLFFEQDFCLGKINTVLI